MWLLCYLGWFLHEVRPIVASDKDFVFSDNIEKISCNNTRGWLGCGPCLCLPSWVSSQVQCPVSCPIRDTKRISELAHIGWHLFYLPAYKSETAVNLVYYYLCTVFVSDHLSFETLIMRKKQFRYPCKVFLSTVPPPVSCILRIVSPAVLRMPFMINIQDNFTKDVRVQNKVVSEKCIFFCNIGP